MPLSTDEQIKAIQHITGKELLPAPEWSEQEAWPLLGLMAYEENHPKYALDETGAHVIGLNLAKLDIEDEKWARVLEVIDPGRLRALNLSDNKLTRFALTEDMQALETINFNGNGALAVFSFPHGGLNSLVRAELNECAFAELMVPAGMEALEALNMRFGKLERLVFKGDCGELKVLDVRDNQLVELILPANLPKLWYFNADKNKLPALEIPGPLPELTTLYIRDNQLEQLDSLNLLQNNKLDALYIHGNPWKLSQALLPESREKNSFGAIKSFLEERKKGEIINDRVKIILVGNGRVGKTSLYRRLRNEPLNPNEPYTHGLSIGLLDEKEFILGVSTDTLHASVWDFGGQEIFYATHQFFLTEGALYILCWTDKTFVQAYRDRNDDDRPFDGIWREEGYWLENIRLQGKDSPVLFVQTHCDKGNLPIPQTIDAKYTSDALRFSADKDYQSKLEDLRREMAKKINEAIPDFGQPFASSYDRLIDAIAVRKKEDPFISLDTFHAIATNPEIDISNVDSALDFLRRSGIVVYYPDNDHLKEVVYIDPNWLTETVYKIFKNDLLETEGRFDQAYLAKVMPKPEYTVLDRERFVALLLQFELIFEEKLNNAFTGNYVAPQYLPDNLRRQAKTFFDKVFRTQKLRFVYRFSRFLPDNVMVNFLSQFGPYSETVIWKEGIWFEDSNNPDLNCTVMLDAKTRSLWVYTSTAPEYPSLSKSILDKFRTLSKQAEAEISMEGERFVVLEKLHRALEERIVEIEDINGKFIKVNEFSYLFGVLHDKMLERFETLPNEEELSFINVAPEIREDLEEAKRSIGFGQSEASLPRIDVSKLDKFAAKTRADIVDFAPSQRDVEDPKLFELLIQKVMREISTSQFYINRKSYVDQTKTKIVFLAANPDGETKLNTEREFRNLREQLRGGKFRDSYECQPPTLDLTVNELLRAFSEGPNIVHFAGHGLSDGIYAVEENGNPLKLTTELLKYIIEPNTESLKMVILNSCLSAELASTISQMGLIVIGHSLKISDPAAIIFTNGFYIGLGEFDNDYRRAFHFGKAKVLSKYPNEALAIEAWKDGKKQNW